MKASMISCDWRLEGLRKVFNLSGDPDVGKCVDW